MSVLNDTEHKIEYQHTEDGKKHVGLHLARLSFADTRPPKPVRYAVRLTRPSTTIASNFPLMNEVKVVNSRPHSQLRQ